MVFLNTDQRTTRGVRPSKDWVKLLSANCGENMESSAELHRGQRCVLFPKYSCEMCRSTTEDHVPNRCLSQEGTFIAGCNNNFVYVP